MCYAYMRALSSREREYNVSSRTRFERRAMLEARWILGMWHREDTNNGTNGGRTTGTRHEEHVPGGGDDVEESQQHQRRHTDHPGCLRVGILRLD